MIRAAAFTLAALLTTGAQAACVVGNTACLPVATYDGNGAFVPPNVPSGTAAAAGGVVPLARLPSAAATTNATVAKASPGRLYKVTGYNAAGVLRRIKFYNIATLPVPGTTPVYFSKPLPPGPFSFDQADLGWSFPAGIAFALVAGAADTDATALAAGDVTDLSIEGQ